MRGSHTFTWENSIPGRWEIMCKGPQESLRLAFQRIARIKKKKKWSGVNKDLKVVEGEVKG